MSCKENNRPKGSSQPKNVAVRKQVLRNALMTEPKKVATVIKHNTPHHDDDQLIAANKARLCALNSGDGSVFGAPKLRSTLGILEKLDALHLIKEQPAKTFDELTPRTKSLANEKVLKKLNFPSDQAVYKHLIPINVNDSMLEVKQRPRHIRRKAIAHDPEPQLADYLRPIKPIEHQLTLAADDDDDNDIREYAATRRKINCNYYRDTYKFYEQYLCPISSRIHGNKS